MMPSTTRRKLSSLVGLAALGSLSWGAEAQAQEFTFDLDEEALEGTGYEVQEVERLLNGAFGEELKVVDQTVFLEQMSEASVMAVKGMGADYASNPQRFVAGFSLGTAVSGAGFTFGRGGGELPEGGFAFQMSGMAGLNLGVAAKEESFWRRFMIYGSGLVAQTNPEPFEASTYHVATHATFKLVRPKPGGVVEWGGLDITSGLELTSSSMSLSQTLPVTAEGFTWDATGSYTVDTQAMSVPLELSTNLRVFIASAFAGVAVDTTRDAEARGTIDLSGPLRYTAGAERDVGTVGLALSDTGLGRDLTYRGFAGVQLNATIMKIYGQLNVSTHGATGGHLGVRVAL